MMTSVEKRRSGRKSGKHRKHSDASSSGSFLDETDREVSSLTDRAFRSLCIGDEAIYNDSDLCSSSPCSQRDVQRALGQSVQHRDTEDRDRDREDLKRAAHESFSLRMQQYGQDLIHGGMYGAQVHGDPQWGVYGERTQVSATFQQSFVETSQQEESLRDKQLLFLSNGARELSLQQRRSRSRVSSLIQAFNSEGYMDGAGMEGKLRERNDETAWDKSALMSIQGDLCEYQQNPYSSHFPSAGTYSSRDASLYSSVSHVNCESSFMRSSHSKHSVAAQANCNSNFFIHSEFSPFKVWKNHNRFPFQQGEVSGFLQCSEFSKWYETPMYKRISLEPSAQGHYRFDERGIRHPRSAVAPAIPPVPSRSTSTSTMAQTATTVEKRCESELAGHYPHRKRAQSLGTNRLPSQRPSTASPTAEMSRRVQDTISSVRALQQKIKMMSEQNLTTAMPADNQNVLYGNNGLIPYGNSVNAGAPNVAGSNTSTTTFNTSQMCAPLVYAHHNTETLTAQQHSVSPQPVEHAPVRAESRGATPDVRMSSYKSRATSLLFNLKDNRKRVKSTYSPTKFKGLEAVEKNRQHSTNEPRDTVIDIPDFPDADVHVAQVEESSRTLAASHQYANQYHRTGYSKTAIHSQPTIDFRGYSEPISDHYQPVQTQGEMVYHYTGFMPENYTSNQLANGQNPHQDLSSFAPYKQGLIAHAGIPASDVYAPQAPHVAREMPRLSSQNNQTGEYLISRPSAQQHFNETAGGELTRVDRYQRFKDNKLYYSNVSSQDRWRQTNNQDAENISLKAAITPWKQETAALKEEDEHDQAYQRAAAIRDEPNIKSDEYRADVQQSTGYQKIELRESFVDGTSSYKNAGSVNPNSFNQLPQYVPLGNNAVETPVFYAQQQSATFEDAYTTQKYSRSSEQNKMTDSDWAKNYCRFDQECGDQPNINLRKGKSALPPLTDQPKSIHEGSEMQSLQPTIENNMLKRSLSNPDDAQTLTMAKPIENTQFVEVKGQDTVEPIKAQHTQAELARPQNRAQVELPKATSDRLILAEQTSSEKVRAEQTNVEPAKFERINEEKAEHIKSKKLKASQTEQSGQASVEHLNTEQTTVHKAAEEPKNISEETGVKRMGEVQGEQVKAEPAKAERLKGEHIKSELVKTEQTKIKRDKSQEAAVEKIKPAQAGEERLRELAETQQIRIDRVKSEQTGVNTNQAKAEQPHEQIVKRKQKETGKGDSNQVGYAHSEHPTKIRNAHDVKEEEKQREMVQTPYEILVKMQERSKNPAAKPSVKQLKNEPDKVERVKTELAKAKAELAKIKEKIRGEPKDKDSRVNLAKEEDIKKNVCLKEKTVESKESKYHDQVAQKDQQRQESLVVSRKSITQADRGAEDYERLREKYGFTDSTSTNRPKLSAEGKVSTDNKNDTQTLSPHLVETTKDEKSKPKHKPENQSPTAARESIENVGTVKINEVEDSHYIYSESSKEFKLSSQDCLTTNADIENTDNSSDKVKKGSSENLEKCVPLKQNDALKQRDLDPAKPLNPERKTKLTEHCVAPSIDQHIAPTRPLTHKERAQTKQEILTSKIKAHAEKEISAIKGFAIRDGLISKTFSKQLAGSQRPEAQRPPSQEASNKQETPGNATPNHQMQASGKQMEAVSPPRPATIPAKPAEITSQLCDHSPKEVPKEAVKTNAKVPTPPKDTNQMGTDRKYEGLVENHKKENRSEIKPPIQSEEALQSKRGNFVENRENTGHQNKNDNSIQATAPQETESSKLVVSEKAQSQQEVVDEEPSLKLVLGQNDTTAADDSLQIMGIMVTVRERKHSVDNGLLTQEQEDQKENEGGNPQVGSILELSKGKQSSSEAATDAQSANHAVKRQNTEMETRTATWTDHQQLSLSRNPQPQRETQFPEPPACLPSPTAVVVKHQVLAERDSVGEDGAKSNTEEASSEKRQTTYSSENCPARAASARVIAQTAIKDDTKSSVKVDTTAVINPSTSRSDSDRDSPPLEQRRNDSIQTNPSPPHRFAEDKNTNVPTKLQHEETEESQEEEEGVHIDSIAIRVVQVVTKDDKKKSAGDQYDISVPCDVAAKDAYKQAATFLRDYKESEETTKDPTPAGSESLRNINQKEIININCEDTIGENKKPESETKQMEEDYFQVQSVEEADNQPHNSANVRDTSAVSKWGDPATLNKASCNESCSESKSEVFALDQSEMKKMESSSAPLEKDILARRIVKTQHNMALKQSDSATERQCNTDSKAESGQSIHTTKQHTENQSSLLARERQRIQLTTRENMAQEKPEVKPRAKEKSSTIPEISAIADYARLKVIVSEDRANTVQEFPPNKKEGFFPLIQSRHSRRPAYTADPQTVSVKEKSFPKKTEVSSKVNKEPKPLVFPITEKEHQRTGMFKLGDKEKQEKMLLNAKTIEKVPDSSSKQADHLKERHKSTSIHQSSIPPVQTTTSTSVNKAGQSFVSQLKHVEKPCQNEKADEAVSNAERMPYLDQISLPQMYNVGENKEITPGTADKIDNALVPMEKKKPEREETVLAQYAETTANMKIKEMVEGSRASLAAEERRAAQREEERRTQEREAIAAQIKERRQKQREAERRAEEERKAKQIEEERISQKEEMRIKAEEERAAKLRQEELQKAMIEESRRRREQQQQQQEMEGHEKQPKDAQEEERQRRAAQEEKVRGDAHAEQLRKTTQGEQQRRAVLDEQQRRAAEVAEQRRAAYREEQQNRAALQKERQRRAAQEEELERRAAHEEQRRAAQDKWQREAAEAVQKRRAVVVEQQRRAAQEEEDRKDAAREEEQQRRTAQDQENQRRAAQEERQRRAAHEEQQKRAAQEEQQRRAAQKEEQLSRAAQEEQQRRAAQKEEQLRRAAQEEQQRRAAQKEEQLRRAAQEEEQKRKAANEEQQRRAAQKEEQQMRAAQEEQQRRAAQKEEQLRRAAQEEQQRRAAQEEEQKRKAANEEQQRRAAQKEEQLRRAAQEEQQRRAAQKEEQQRRAAQEEEQKRKAANEELQRRAAQEKQQRRAAQEDQQRKVELRRRAAVEEQQKRAAQEKEMQREAAQKEEQQRSASHEEEQKRRAVQEEQLRREERQRRAAVEERRRRAAQAEQQRTSAWIEDQTKHKAAVDVEEENKRNQREEGRDSQILEERGIKHAKIKAQHQAEEPLHKEPEIDKHREETQTKETPRIVDKRQVVKEERSVAQEQILTQRREVIKAQKGDEEEEKVAVDREKDRVNLTEEQKRAAQMMDAVQYYTIASESERKGRERQLRSPPPSTRKSSSSVLESTEDSLQRPNRPHAPASPAISLPRSNTSSPALGSKPSMFRVKDNTIRGSSFIKSVKPRFHKNFGEDFRVGSPAWSERGEEEPETARHGITTPLHHDTGLNRLAAIRESSALQSGYLAQDHSAPLPHHRPYSRRSFALDEDDSRSVISNMSEDVESFATSAADLADLRGLYDYDRPESSCSFSSDVCRSLGKPPAVPPKSEKALRRAKRLATRRIKKELPRADGTAGLERPPQEESRIPSSSSTEVLSPSRHAVATPHFSSPVSLARAPTLEPSLPPPHTEHQPSRSSLSTAPHATSSISPPAASPHAAASLPLPVASPQPAGPVSHAAAPKTVADVPSSPSTLHHASHPAPVTKYHVESGYPNSYPLTQRKVLQDVGSGQYFVVDVPVQVKTKTFFDPQTGKYVQLNVRESAKRSSQLQPQQTYLQPQLQPQTNVTPQQEPISQDLPVGKPLALFQGYHSYPAGINHGPHNKSSTPVTPYQNQQPARESHTYGHPASDRVQNTEGRYYSPEKTPYMDTVNDIDKTHHSVYNTHGQYESFPECDTNSQLAGSLVYENDNSAPSQYQPREIITMSELEDFMELSDW